jgi:iron complex transport system substrate-binding protein
MPKNIRLGLIAAAVIALLIGAIFGVRQLPGFSSAARPARDSSAGKEILRFRDDVGREIELPVPVTRTVAFNRYTTEFIRAIAGMKVIVGVDFDAAKASAYWPGVTNAMVVGQGQTAPNYESIIAVKPDVVFFPRNSLWEEASRVLKPFGIPVVVLTGWDVLKHEENVELLGRIYRMEERAAELNAFYTHYRDLLAERLKGIQKKRVYMEEVGEFKTLLKGSGWHDMIESGGGLNVFGDVKILDQPSARGTVQGFDTDPEEILARKPDVIIKLYPNQYESIDPANALNILKGIAARPGFSELPAVRNRQVYSISYYHASGCSKIVGALQIAKWLYPERFTDIDPAEAMRVWLEKFQGVPYPGGYWISLLNSGTEH